MNWLNIFSAVGVSIGVSLAAVLQALVGSYLIRSIMKSIEILECNFYPAVTVLCEPQLGRRGLYPNLSIKKSNQDLRNMMNLISYSDGKKSLLEISLIINVSFWEILPIVNKLVSNGLIKKNWEVKSES